MREIQIKITKKSYQSVRIAVIKMLKITSVGEDMEKRENLCTVSGSINWWSHFVEV